LDAFYDDKKPTETRYLPRLLNAVGTFRNNR